jgi:hypothetical protein
MVSYAPVVDKDMQKTGRMGLLTGRCSSGCSRMPMAVMACPPREQYKHNPRHLDTGVCPGNITWPHSHKRKLTISSCGGALAARAAYYTVTVVTMRPRAPIASSGCGASAARGWHRSSLRGHLGYKSVDLSPGVLDCRAKFQRC